MIGHDMAHRVQFARIETAPRRFREQFGMVELHPLHPGLHPGLHPAKVKHGKALKALGCKRCNLIQTFDSHIRAQLEPNPIQTAPFAPRTC